MGEPPHSTAFLNFIPDISLYRSEPLVNNTYHGEWLPPGWQSYLASKFQVGRISGDQCFSGKSSDQQSKIMSKDGTYYRLLTQIFADSRNGCSSSEADYFLWHLLFINFHTRKTLLEIMSEISGNGTEATNFLNFQYQSIAVLICILLFDSLFVDPETKSFLETSKLGSLRDLSKILSSLQPDSLEIFRSILGSRGISDIV